MDRKAMGRACRMNVVESKFDSDVFGYKVGKLEVEDWCAPLETTKQIRLENRNLDVVFVKIPRWVYPEKDAVAVDYRYEMEGSIFSGARASEKVTLTQLPGKSERLRAVARTSFVGSRFFRDRKLAKKAPEMYARWLDGSGSCWTLAGLEETAFLIQTWDAPSVARVSLIAVHPEARGLGIASRLLGCVIGNLNATLWKVCVSAENVRAICLYETVGFRVASASTAYHVWI